MTLRVVRQVALTLVATVVVAACTTSAALAPETPAPFPVDEYRDSTLTSGPPVGSPNPTLYAKLRVFVASESTNQVWVLEGPPGKEFAVVAKIPVSSLPHQLSVSPDGKWVAVNNRMGNSTSIIDPIVMKELARIPVGKQPHGIIWAPDGKTIFISHERENYIGRIEAGTWRPLPPLFVGVSQHVSTIWPERPNELWFTVTNSVQPNHLRMYDLSTNQIAQVKVQDVHDVFFTPDGSELWSSSSGFLDKPSDRIVIYEPLERTVKQEIHFPGRYPFHSMKVDRDGVFFLADKSLMVLSDHLGPALLWVDWKARKIVGETKLGQQPFHTTYDPLGDRVLTTTNLDGMVNVIDVPTRKVVQKVSVPKPHGIVSVPLGP